MEQILYRVALRFKEECIKEAIRLDAVATGKMITDVDVEKGGKGRFIVSFNAPYTGYVEFGTNPRDKYPPKEAIVDWLVAKYGMSRKEANRKAWGVMHKIKVQGTKPKAFIRTAIARLTGE